MCNPEAPRIALDWTGAAVAPKLLVHRPGQVADHTAHGWRTMWRESSSGTVIAKPDPTRKIDAAVAAVVAYERATQQPEPAVMPIFSILA